MTADLVTHHLQDALMLVMILSLPVLGVAALVGLVVAPGHLVRTSGPKLHYQPIWSVRKTL